MHLTENHTIRRSGKQLLLSLVLFLLLLMPNDSRSQEKTTRYGGRTIVCLIQLEHVDAEYLASVLEPFLSPQGSIVSYQPTNTLIIKARAPVVNMLSEVIKGKPCVPVSGQPEDEIRRQQKENAP